jgi:aryl-alcohol dehydrogenase-like predicted oxidoreductase
MDYARLGRTGLKVSRLCLGTMNFGPQTTEEDSHRIMDRAHEHGINFFDTADVYGWKRGEGWTEQIVGRWFEKGGHRRDRTVLATKVYGQMGDWPNDSRLSAHHIVRACEASLRRLKTDRIDLYQMHHVDRDSPWDEVWQAMETLVGQGKVIYVGSSNFAGWHIAQANEAAKARHFLGLVSEQSLYNLIDRTIELEVIPSCQAYGLGLIPWSPLKGGVLGGALKKAQEGRRTSENAQRAIERHRDRLEAFEGLSSEIGIPAADVALAWLLGRPAVTAPIIGPRTIDQLDEAVKVLGIRLEKEVLDRLETIFPGPGGPAPEAYAW